MRRLPGTPGQLGFVLGLGLFVVLLFLPPIAPFQEIARETVQRQAVALEAETLASSLQSVFALLLVMVIWWITEAIPLPATALLPAVILPFLHVVGVSGDRVFLFDLKNTLQSYASPVIFLFLGGFLLAATMQKWGLDRRITLWLLTRGNIANSSRLILLGMMGVTAFLSMWISNTACTAMMLPLGLGILGLMQLKPGESRFGLALMLGIAWSASIGGVGTVIGSPPNGIALGILNSTFPDGPARISFLDWMKFGVPYVLLTVPLAWGILVVRNPPEVRAIPGGRERLMEERAALGPIGRGEKLAISVFVLAVLLWVSNPFWPALLPSSIAARLSWVDEYTIGLLAGLICFVLPVDFRQRKFLLEWKDTHFVDWGTLILFGGGIALSEAMFKTGLAAWIATSFVGAFGPLSTLAMMIAIVLMVDFLTEVASNTAVTGMIVPIVISIALKTGGDPTTLTVAAAVAASMAFMLPVATPPNALVFGTGYVRVGDMVRNGFVLDILGWLLTVGILYLIGGLLFGVLHF